MNVSIEHCEMQHIALEKRLTTMQESLNRIEEALTGNVGGDRPGLQSRVLQLEQAEKDRKRIVWVCLTTAVGSVIAAFSAWVKVRLGVG